MKCVRFLQKVSDAQQCHLSVCRSVCLPVCRSLFPLSVILFKLSLSNAYSAHFVCSSWPGGLSLVSITFRLGSFCFTMQIQNTFGYIYCLPIQIYVHMCVACVTSKHLCASNCTCIGACLHVKLRFVWLQSAVVCCACLKRGRRRWANMFVWKFKLK